LLVFCGITKPLLYRKEPFANDREWVEHLFRLYEGLTAPMLVAARKGIRAKKTKKDKKAG
jgi:hypothetical protein